MPPISLPLTTLIRTVTLALAFCFSAAVFSPLMAAQATDECAAESTEWEEAEAIADGRVSRVAKRRTARPMIYKERALHPGNATKRNLPPSCERDRLNGCGCYLRT